jgi:hypothetical protein
LAAASLFLSFGLDIWAEGGTVADLFSAYSLHYYTNTHNGQQVEIFIEPYDARQRLRFSYSSRNPGHITFREEDLVGFEATVARLARAVNQRLLDYNDYSKSAMALREFAIDSSRSDEPANILKWSFLYEPKRLQLVMTDHRRRTISGILMPCERIVVLHDLARLWVHQIRAEPDTPVLEEGEFYE